MEQNTSSKKVEDSASSLNARIQQLEGENMELKAAEKERHLEIAKFKDLLGESEGVVQRLKQQQLQNQYDMEEVKIIINLQDELKASREAIAQLKSQIELISLGKEGRDEENYHDKLLDIAFQQTSQEKEVVDEENMKVIEDDSMFHFKRRFQELKQQLSQLEINRALGEFELRDRITNDSLKYHRRLIYWKEKCQELEKTLAKVNAQHKIELKELRTTMKLSASSILQHTLSELKQARTRVNELETELGQQPKRSSAGDSRRVLEFYKEKDQNGHRQIMLNHANASMDWRLVIASQKH